MFINLNDKVMFTQSCFIKKNSIELRNKLEKIGYKNGAWESPHFEYPYLMCYPNRKFGLLKGNGFYITETPIKYDGQIYDYKVPDDCIDCGDNEDLFLAIAALRNDSDKYQWFINPITKTIRKPDYYPQLVGMDGIETIITGYEWFYTDEQDGITEKINNAVECGENPDYISHKATVEELIKHFKK